MRQNIPRVIAEQVVYEEPRCFVCGSEQELEINHIEERSAATHHPLLNHRRNLVRLCAGHHRTGVFAFHRSRRYHALLIKSRRLWEIFPRLASAFGSDYTQHALVWSPYSFQSTEHTTYWEKNTDADSIVRFLQSYKSGHCLPR